jgi:UDP-glucuronate 4-epimerase
MKILITGAAGFIGYHLVKALAQKNMEIVGLDNINDYYDVRLKYDRLSDCGVACENIRYGEMVKSNSIPSYRFIRLDLTDSQRVGQLFAEEKFTHICNLAGQPGVRYSIENPYSYIQSNVLGFLNILEACRNYQVSHLLFASSSSVYGMESHVPFLESDNTDHPVSLYAATKKSDEVMAYAYSKLYGIQTIGLRFFTVYGPWGRPDMAPVKFMKSILHQQPIQVYNQGKMLRDFTYIGDIIKGICLILEAEITDDVPNRTYNIGNSNPIQLLDFIHTIEEVTGRKANMEMLGMQPGDVTRTYADITRISKDFGYKPSITLYDGIQNLYLWYKQYSLDKEDF